MNGGDCAGCEKKNAVDLSPEAVAALVDAIPISESEKAGAEVFEKRLALCSSCEALKEDVLCGYCGCFVRFRARARKGYCPHPAGEKWPALPAVSERHDTTPGQAGFEKAITFSKEYT